MLPLQYHNFFSFHRLWVSLEARPLKAITPQTDTQGKQNLLASKLTAALPDDYRALEPPDPIPNSVVKRCIANGSVGSPHVRVGHRQAPKTKGSPSKRPFFYACKFSPYFYPRVLKAFLSSPGANNREIYFRSYIRSGTLH